MDKTYEPIATQTLGSAAATVTFSSIPQTYTDLVLVCSTQGTTVTAAVTIRYNSDTGSNYSVTRLYGDGSTATSNRYSNQTSAHIGDWMPNATYFFPIVTQIQNYSNTTTYKTHLSRFGASSDVQGAIVGLWRSTAAINTITIMENQASAGTNFKIGSTFTLYGIKAA